MKNKILNIFIIISVLFSLCSCQSKNTMVMKSNVNNKLDNSFNIPVIKRNIKNVISKPTITPTPSPKPNFDIKLTIAGDFMLASYKGETKTGNFNDYVKNKDPSYFLQNVKPFFEEDDWTIVNLENVLTDDNLQEIYKDYSPAYWYKGPTSNTNILTSSSIEVVNLSNNHTGDYGNKGKIDTINAVTNAGLLYGNSDKTLYLEKNGYTIALICNGLWASYQADNIIKRINEASENSDFQIIYYHGGTERIHSPEQWKIDSSHKLVDNGADLVIGNHPHVLQPKEEYNGTDIIYSMGNFCYGGNKKPENRTILYQITLTVSPEGELVSKTSEIIPCYVYTDKTNNYCPGIIENESEKQSVLDFMNWKTDSPI